MVGDKKRRPCLRCDQKFLTTPETRICAACKDSVYDPNKHCGGGRSSTAQYAGYQAALRGLEYNYSFHFHVSTRNWED